MTLTAIQIARTRPGDRLADRGVIVEKLAEGDDRFRLLLDRRGKRVRVTLGKLSEGVTLRMARAALAELRTQTEGPKTALRFSEEPTS